MSTVAVVECWSCGGLDESTAAATGGYTGHTGHCWPRILRRGLQAASRARIGTIQTVEMCFKIIYMLH